jgi:hypothetical protein
MSAVAPPRTPEFATPLRAFGPLTRSRLRRLGLVYLVMFTFGIGLALFATAPGTQAFGLGLAFPGGGFLHYLAGGAGGIAVHLACAALTFVLFVFGLLLWFGTGNQAAPVVVWIGGALAAAAMGHAHTFAGSWLVVSGLAGVTFGGAWFGHRRLLAGKLARREQRRASVGTCVPPATALDISGRPAVAELSADDLAALRYALDRALQPIDEFNGFDFIDQFQPSAVRYQINNLGYALSFANYTRLPAMRGYLVDAQRRLIEKKKQHRVWKYWALESLWGNFRHEPNPMARDNVMYSGWYAAQIGLFEAATGDFSCAEPGALTLRSANGTEYVNDFHTLAATLAENERNSEFCLFPCEPNWIYPLCNNQAALGLRLHDRLHGTHYWRDVEAQYRRRLEQEFIDVDGHLVLLRSTRTGLTIPGLQSSSEDAIAAFWMHPLFPDIAARLWEIARSELFRSTGAGLELLPLKPWLDAGNYRFNTAYALGALGMAARELGDDDAAQAIRGAIDELDTARHGGVLSYPGCSTWSHTFMLNMRVGRANGLSDLVNEERPAAWRDGPYIDDAPYPEVLPARAVSDGAALEAVLYPGAAGGRFDVTLAGLRAGVGYRLDGCIDETTTADADGRLRLAVELDVRREIRVAPQS